MRINLIFLLVFCSVVSFGQTVETWLYPDDENIGSKKHFIVGDSTTGTDKLRALNMFGVGILTPTEKAHFRLGSNDFRVIGVIGDSLIQFETYDSITATQYKLTLNAYSNIFSIERDSTGSAGDIQIFINSTGLELLSARDNVRINTPSAASGYVLTSNGTDGRCAWAAPAASSGWLTIVEQSTSTTGANGNYYYYDVTSDSDTLTLPASPTDDDLIGVYLSATSGSNTLTIDRNGNTIAGLANNAVLYINNDYLILQFINGDWVIVSNGIQIHTACMTRDAAQSIGSGGAPTIIAFETEEWDYGGIADAAGDRFVIRRTGLYEVTTTGGLNTVNAATAVAYIYKNGTDIRQRTNTLASSGLQMFSSSTIESFAAGDIITIRYYQDGTGSINTPTNYNKPRTTITEQ